MKPEIEEYLKQNGVIDKEDRCHCCNQSREVYKEVINNVTKERRFILKNSKYAIVKEVDGNVYLNVDGKDLFKSEQMVEP